jgi:ParB family chromosome partitioning protein
MAQGNRGFADLVANTTSPAPATPRLPPRTGLLGARENRLAELAAGNAVTRVNELVDPACCRIWDGHNRDYGALDAQNCADLIESLRAQGRQEVPAIVRRVSDDPKYAYEVICGARRHWALTWLRANNYPQLKFLIEPRELTDEEAFRVADLENRNRRDLSDYERATDYARAVHRYYGGSQQRMADRLDVSKSWLSRYLELAKMPAEVLAAFGSPHVVGISHGAVLGPLLRIPQKRDRLLKEAEKLAAQQSHLSEQSAKLIPPGLVVRGLAEAAEGKTGKARRKNTKEHVVRDYDGSIVARGQQAGRGGGLAITIPHPRKHTHSDLIAAVTDLLTQMTSATGEPPYDHR